MDTAETEAFGARMAKRRATWGPGPWTSEPDREAFEAEGFPCIIQRGGGGAWCGYVGIPPGHRLHGKGYYVSSPVSCLDVHGGITYAESCRGAVCHVPRPGEPEDVWWLGFDCAHSGDLTPVNAALGVRLCEFEAYRDVAYVTSETRRLAAQLREMSTWAAPRPRTVPTLSRCGVRVFLIGGRNGADDR